MAIEDSEPPNTIHVRDSADPKGPQLAFGASAWAAFLPYACDGDANPG
ncbi:DUF397 domain-containing protein [Streptomyces albofaciens JCM 4342]|nr:DUF397 domain-containing protein [Streptomyces albofaciens]KAA6221318.1 DUF397 domain-containing protein [Streptomyces albofaciens JCM 4342]